MLHKFSDCYYYIHIKPSGGILEKLNFDFPLGSASECQLGERFGEEDIISYCEHLFGFFYHL